MITGQYFLLPDAHEEIVAPDAIPRDTNSIYECVAIRLQRDRWRPCRVVNALNRLAITNSDFGPFERAVYFNGVAAVAQSAGWKDLAIGAIKHAKTELNRLGSQNVSAAQIEVVDNLTLTEEKLNFQTGKTTNKVYSGLKKMVANSGRSGARVDLSLLWRGAVVASVNDNFALAYRALEEHAYRTYVRGHRLGNGLFARAHVDLLKIHSGKSIPGAKSNVPLTQIADLEQKLRENIDADFADPEKLRLESPYFGDRVKFAHLIELYVVLNYVRFCLSTGADQIRYKYYSQVFAAAGRQLLRDEAGVCVSHGSGLEPYHLVSPKILDPIVRGYLTKQDDDIIDLCSRDQDWSRAREQANRILASNVRTIAHFSAQLEVNPSRKFAVPCAEPFPMNKIKTLFLSANPTRTSCLALDDELRSILEKIRAAEHRDAFEMVVAPAARPDDIEQALLQHKPVIVQFSGHGSDADGLMFQGDALGEAKPVSADAIGDLFKLLRKNVRVVVLNACYSELQAAAIVREVDFVVGMRSAIGDAAARKFSASFYRGLSFGETVATAFGLGVNALKREGLVFDENVPVLLIRSGVSAEVALLDYRKANNTEHEAAARVIAGLPKRNKPDDN